MSKKIKKLTSFILMIIMSSMLFTGCSNTKQPGDRLKEIKPISIKVEGVEFKVGESKLADILKGGLLISTDKTFKKGIDSLKLDKMTYYLACINKDGYHLGDISFVNNTKNSIEYKDCILSKYTMKFKNATPQDTQYKYDNILIDEINFKGMNINQVKDVMSKKSKDVTEFKEPDGSIAILNYNVNNVTISISFDFQTKIVSQVKVEVSNIYFE